MEENKNQKPVAENENYQQQLNDQEQHRREKLEQYKALGVDPFGQKYEVSAKAADLKKDFDYLQAEEVKEDASVTIAGRIVLLRKMGKASFFTLQDRTGKIQIYIRQDVVGEENYALFKMADLGDICGIEGLMMKTKTGEVTIRATRYTHLVKALRPLPDKFHGLSDPEDRRRKRYVDLIVNEDSRYVAMMRPRIVRGIQQFFDEKGFVEFETSILQPILGGANAKPFVTHFNALDQDFYLRIATELSLKKLLVGGMERVYEMGRMFRNEGIDTTHNPEFTTLEAYMAYGDLGDMEEMTEELYRYLATSIVGKTTLTWLGNEIDLAKPFRKATMTELIKENCGVDFYEVKTLEEALELAKKYNVPVEKHYAWGHVLNAFFEKYVEEKLIQPTFVLQHPVDISPLAKKDPSDSRFTQRFELYISTKEMCNAFTELNDPIDQRARFEEQVEEKKNGNEEACEVDTDFCEALEYGMPPAGGIGYGIDRTVMMLLERDSIRDVLIFPTLKRKM
ncbi:MAG: lysine--tRNA ligase [Bacilli bacterium]